MSGANSEEVQIPARGAVFGPYMCRVVEEGGDCAVHLGVRGAIGTQVGQDEMMDDEESEYDVAYWGVFNSRELLLQTRKPQTFSLGLLG